MTPAEFADTTIFLLRESYEAIHVGIAKAESLNDYALGLEHIDSTRAPKARAAADAQRALVAELWQTIQDMNAKIDLIVEMSRDHPELLHSGVFEDLEWPTPVSHDGYVYFIRRELDGAIKIGWSIDPEQRLQAHLVAAGPCTLLAQMPGVRADETKMHRRFKAQRIHGEWFTLNDELLELIYRYNVFA